MRAALMLLLLALAAFWPSLNRGEWQGTEGRRVMIAQEMLASGDFLVPRLGGEVTLAKPPFFYWNLAAVQAGFGVNAFALRAVSVIALWLFALAAWAAVRSFHGGRAGAIAAAGALTSPAVLYHGGHAEIDPSFAAWTGISLVWLAVGVATEKRLWLALAGIMGGVAFLTKGPPYLAFLLGSLLVWWRHAGLRGFWWFTLPAILVGSSYYIVLAMTVDLPELARVAASESVGRLGEFDWVSLWTVPTFLARAAVVTLPLGLWTLTEYRGKHEARLQPREILLRMCVGAALAGVLVLVVFPSRPTRYLVPAVLLFVVAVAPAVAGFTRLELPPRRGQLAVVAVLGLLGGVALLVLPWLPIPLPWRSLGFALLVGLAPFVVKSRPALVVYALVVPLIGAWTVLVDRDAERSHGTRSAAQVAVVLREELDRRGATDIQTFGHFSHAIQLHAGLALAGDEFGRRVPSSRWLLVEDVDGGDEDDDLFDEVQAFGRYRERVRIRARRRAIVLLERSGP